MTLKKGRQMFENFPKTRKPLPSEYQAIYENFYKSNRNGESTASGAAQKMERWLHKKVAADTQGLNGHKTLEIGAGTLNQLDFEQDFSHYDIIEPFTDLYQGSPRLSKIRKIYKDISEVAHECGVGNERERKILRQNHILCGFGAYFKPAKRCGECLLVA